MNNTYLKCEKCFFIIITIVAFTLFSFNLQANNFAGNTYLLPVKLTGVNKPIISLNGQWQFRYSPESKWASIRVPGEAAMQGYAIEHDKPFCYRRLFSIPADYASKRIILRFDGVYSHAKLLINGKFVREHHGGFTRWETDITSYVRIGKKNEIILELTDRLDEISYASGYAHHPIGGILRDVTLFALPDTPIYNVAIETELDTAYQDAILRFCYRGGPDKNAEIELTLTDPNGEVVALVDNRFPLSSTPGKMALKEIAVKNPQKWDAEHPYLYTLTAAMYEGKNEIVRFSQKVGFREIKVDGNRLLVNGKPVKLRGACRHDIHPTLGRTTTPELDSLDVLLFKQSNMNFVRTSHYPPSEKFLEYCDRYGIYVECESAVCFVNTHRQKNYAPAASQSDPEYSARYLGQCQEMVNSFRSHPAILLWSIGNESSYGSNFQLCWDWIKRTDTTRPVIFSYPGSVDQKEKIYDILSMHYQDVYGNLSQWGMTTQNFQGHGIPALFDEWAHPACYTYTTLQNDPNIREFWGQSLDMMWSRLFDATGGLGGAIWGYIDETFALPGPKVGTAFWKEFARTAKPEAYQGNCVGYGEWGIVDVWRRKKPEFWSTQKAYSPIRLLTDKLESFTSGQQLVLSIYNRFDHTYLNEVKAYYTYNGQKKELTLSPVAPHEKGVLVVPAENWQTGKDVKIEFLNPDGMLIDAYRLTLGKEEINYPMTLFEGGLTVDDNDNLITVRGEGFEVPFDKTSGLIVEAKTGEQILIEKGPFLNLYINLNHLTGAEVRKTANRFVIQNSDWQKKAFNYRQQADGVYIDLSGRYKDITVEFKIKISPNGVLDISYLTAGVPNGFLRETGLSFLLSEQINHLNWKRKGYWSYYPEGEFAGNQGDCSLYESRQSHYGEAPVQNWQADTHNYFYWADAGVNCKKPLTQMAKGMKENIYFYTLSTVDKNALTVCSPNASVACRLNKQPSEQLILYTNNRWDYPEIAWGNYCKTLEALPCFGSIQLLFK